MSNRAKREGVVKYGREARVGGTDPLQMRQLWCGRRGIIGHVLMMVRVDARDLEPEQRKTAHQWFDWFTMAWEHATPREAMIQLDLSIQLEVEGS